MPQFYSDYVLIRIYSDYLLMQFLFVNVVEVIEYNFSTHFKAKIKKTKC